MEKNIMEKIIKLDYPYYNLYYKFNKKNILNIIKNFVPDIYYDKFDEIKNMKIQKYIINDTQYFIIKDIYKKTSIINNITDYFSESVRVNCKFGNYLSPMEYWNKNKIIILKKTYKKYKKISIHNVREIIIYNTKLCNNFRISVALSVLQHFKPQKWLDISAGWGDRLLSAIFYKINLYVSCDPNLDLHPCYDNMIKTFVPESKRKNFIIYKNGFLEAPIKDEDFDIVFSSPPFFKLEIYSGHKENSVVQYDSEKSWCDNFFVKSLIKAYNLLKKNGHMILYMSASDYVMYKMYSLGNIMEYKGQIYFYEKVPRGMFVWKKNKDDKITSLE